MSASISTQIRLRLCVAVGLLWVMPGAAEAFDRLETPAGSVEVREIDGRVVGFDVLDKQGVLIAPIRFSANGVFQPDTTEQANIRSQVTLCFSQFRCQEGVGLELSPDSSVSLVWNKDSLFPEIHFTFIIDHFDVLDWRESQADVPFHFLICSLPEAEVFHQRGWLIATPPADPFSLQQAPHAGQPEIRSAWSENWSYIPALGCHPIPTIGLWAAHHHRYVGYDFSETRLLDNSEKDVGTVYCWRHRGYRQFIALTFPTSGESVDRLACPASGDRITSHFRLIWSQDLPPTKDPNRFLIERLVETVPGALPLTPAVNDLDYMPGPTRLDSFTEPRPRNIIGVGSETRFYEEGTVVIHGWKSHIGSWVDRLFETGRAGAMANLREQADRLLRSAKRFRVEDDHCLYWEKPVHGTMLPAFGGEPATTLHNSDGFAAARCLLNLWKHDEDPRYLEAAEGALAWARHIVWTRNEFVDVPSAPFAIGGSLPIAFLLDYYYLFRDDPERSRRAREALDLAVTFAYRYLPVWLYDNNRDDTLDSAFLLEPNAGRDWAGVACANEVTWQIEAAAEVMLTTGDAILKTILHGILERWPLLYRDEYQTSVAEYGSSFTECLGLYPGCKIGTGHRASYGWAEPFHLLYPVGKTKARVVCGEGTCFVTNRGGRHTTVEDYRTDGRSGFYFRLVSKLTEPFDVSVSIPRINLRTLPLSRKRGRKKVSLRPGTDYSLAAERSDSLILHDVRDGDQFLIGSDTGEIKPSGSLRPEVEPSDAVGPFTIIRPKKTEPPDCDWLDTDSMAGLFAGLQYACGIPFRIEGDQWGNPRAWHVPITIGREADGRDLFLFWIPDGPDAELVVTRLGDTSKHLRTTDCAPVRRGWPPIFRWRLLAVYVPAEENPVRKVTVRDGQLMALTSAPADLAPSTGILDRLEQTQEAWEAELAFESDLDQLVQRAAGIDFSQLAILPPYGLSGVAARLLFETGISRKAHHLERRELVDRSVLNPERYPVLLVAGGEEYLHTMNREGDAKEALMNYVNSGGTLFICGPGPFPMYYARGREGMPSEPFLPQVGIPIITVLDSRPTMGWMIHREKGADLFSQLPERFPFPTTGDLRLRPINRQQVPESCTYRPLLSVYDEQGELVGDAAAWLTFSTGPQKGLQVFYIWGPLLKHPDYAAEITLAVISELVKVIGDASAPVGGVQ